MSGWRFFLEITDSRTICSPKIALIAIFFSPGEMSVCLAASAHRWMASDWGGTQRVSHPPLSL